MSLTAVQLSKFSLHGKILDELVRTQLGLIDEKLQRHEKNWGRNIVSYELPLTMVLPGLDKRESQRLIYASIIRSLKRRGFELALTLEHNKNILYIAWVTDLDRAELEALNLLIKSVKVSREQLLTFVNPSTGRGSGRPEDVATPASVASKKIKTESDNIISSLPHWAEKAGAPAPPPPPSRALQTK